MPRHSQDTQNNTPDTSMRFRENFDGQSALNRYSSQETEAAIM